MRNIYIRDTINHITNNYKVSESFSAPNMSIAFGDWCFTPVRCLFDGNKVTVTTLTPSRGNSFKPLIVVDHEKDMKRNFFRVIASIVLIIPGLILGSLFKGLGYLSHSIRQRHNLAMQHYTPRDYIIGVEEKRLSLDGIKEDLSKARESNLLNQPVKNLMIFAEDGTTIGHDPGFMALNPQKLILVGARIVSATRCGLDEKLSQNPEWESRMARLATLSLLEGTENDADTFTIQRKVNSVEAALEDTPPRLSPFSFKRYHRVYVVQSSL